MALNNQTLGMQLGQRLQWGQGMPSFDTKSDLWKQQIDPWVQYYNRASAPEAGSIFNKIRNTSAPAAPGDTNSLAAQFAKSYSDFQRSSNNNETQQLISGTGGFLPQAALNDQYLKWYAGNQAPEVQGIFNSPVANKNSAARSDLAGYEATLKSEMAALAGNGYNAGSKSGNTQEQINRMVPDLARYGVSSLNDLAARKVRSPYTGKDVDVFYNTRTGAVIPTNFGSSMKGEGGSNYRLYNYNGRVLPVANWKDTSEAADLAPLALVLGMVAPVALGAMGATGAAASGLASSTGMSTGLATGLANAGVSGLTQGALTAAMGGNFGQGFLGGALGSGIASGVGSLGIGSSVANSLAPLGNTANSAAMNAALAGGVNSALARGLTGGLTAGMMGGDAGRAALAGALSGGVSGATSGYLANDLGSGLSGTVGSLAGKYLTPTFSNPAAPQQNSAPSGSVAAPISSGQIDPGQAGPLMALRQLQQRIQGSGLSEDQRQRAIASLNNLASTGQQKFGWM